MSDPHELKIEGREAQEFSGRLSLRVPRGLHRTLMLRAREEGVNLNKLAVAILAVAVDWDARAEPGDRHESEPATERRKPAAVLAAEEAGIKKMIRNLLN